MATDEYNSLRDDNRPICIFGCGYLGAALAASLLASGRRVVALTRNADTAARLRKIGVERVIVAQLHDTGWHADLTESCGAWVNCVSSAGGGLDGYEKSYVQGMQSIIKWMRTTAQRPVTVIYTSSTSVYPQDGGVWVDESADCQDAPPTGQVLLRSEALLRSLAGEARAFVFRLAGIYGPGRTYLLNQVRNGADVLPGSGHHHLNLIHRDDAVNAIQLALDSPEVDGGVFNLADGQPHRKEAVVAWLAESLGLACPRFDPQQVTSRLARRGGAMPDRRISNRRVLETLGWQATYPSFREGFAPLIID